MKNKLSERESLMEPMEVEWVDETEWQEIEAAVAAAVQQRAGKVRQAAIQDEAHITRKRRDFCGPSVRVNETKDFCEEPQCTVKRPGVIAGASGAERQDLTGVKLSPLGLEWAPTKRQVSIGPGQLSSVGPAQLSNVGQGQLSEAPGQLSISCRQCPHQLLASSPQQVLSQAASLSEWVPSQTEFGGFRADCPTAGAQLENLGDPSASDSQQAHKKPCNAVRQKSEVSDRQTDSKRLETSGTERRSTAMSAKEFSQAQPVEAPKKDAKAETKQSEPQKERRLPTWLTSAKPPLSSEECTLPKMRFEGSIVYAMSPVEVDCCARALLEDLRGKEACLGFDIEWKVTFRKGEIPNKAALIQLCPSASCCYLLHIVHSGITSALQTLLEEDSIKKAGAGIYGDAHKLRRDFGISMGGLQDLSDLANERLQPEEGPKKWSLTALAQEAMSMQVEKPPKQRISDWERLPLSADQQHYAATDAFASLRLYEVLMVLPAPPPRPILRPLPQSEVNTLACPGHSPGQELWVPAAAEPAYLAPSKMDVHKMHLEGLRIEKIAEKKRVRVTTVEGYLVEAMQAGLAYAWHRMGVSDVVKKRVEEAIKDEIEELERAELSLSENDSREPKGNDREDHAATSGRSKVSGELIACSSKLRGNSLRKENGQAGPNLERRERAGEDQLLNANPFQSSSSEAEPCGEDFEACAVQDVSRTADVESIAVQRLPLNEGSSADQREISITLDRKAGAKEMLDVIFTAEKLRGLKLRALMDRIPLEESITFSQVKLVIAHLARMAEAETSRQKRLKLLANG